MRGLVWMLHGEPATLAEATTLDTDHMELLEQAATGHFDKIARRTAQRVLAAIDHDIGSGRDPLDPVNPMEQRLEALQTLKRGSGRYFSGFFDEELNSNSETSSKAVDRLVSKFETSGTKPRKPVSNIEASIQPIDLYVNSKFETGDNSSNSSSSSKETTTTDNETMFGNTVATHTEFQHLSVEVPSDGLRGNSVANTTSTTSLPSGAETGTDDGTTFQWPTSFDDNRKRLVQRMLQHHLPELPDDQQEVINALSAKLEDKSDPIRNLGYYVAKLCKLARAGELCPVIPPSPPVSPAQSDKKIHINNLRGEISSLQQLIEATQRSGSAGLQTLEAQLAQCRAQLRELELTRH
jgi:hypothetical protein